MKNKDKELQRRMNWIESLKRNILRFMLANNELHRYKINNNKFRITEFASEKLLKFHIIDKLLCIVLFKTLTNSI